MNGVENLLFACNAVLPTFAIVLLGSSLKKIGVLQDTLIQQGNTLCFQVLFPILFFFQHLCSRENKYFLSEAGGDCPDCHRGQPADFAFCCAAGHNRQTAYVRIDSIHLSWEFYALRTAFFASIRRC